MSNPALAQKIFEAVKVLPDAQASEVLDFAAFVAQRARTAEWHDLQNAQLSSLTELWDNEADEVWNDA